MATLQVSFDKYRPKACAFYAGRIWYAGVPSGEKLGWVLFSQVLDTISNAPKCYQRNDPTSEVFSDILDTDGGLIQIPEAGEIVSLMPMGRNLYVFGTNGVWQIVGGDNGFTAASYSVEKVSNAGCLFQKTIVLVDEVIYYWSASGIYVLALDQTGINASARNISDAAIKTFYQSIPTGNKIYAVGKYNDSSKIIQWLYYQGTTETVNNRFLKNRVLAYNVQLNAFYTYSIDEDAGPKLVAVAVTRETSESTADADVVVGDVDVIVNDSQVTAPTLATLSNTKQFKYAVLHKSPSTYALTFGDMLGDVYRDWYSYDNVGVSFDSYIITGYNMAGNGPARTKTASYLTAFMARTETSVDENMQPVNSSGIKMQTRWDFTDNLFSNKWSDETQIYRILRPLYYEPSSAFNNGYPLVITKNKIRGRGKALQVKFSADGDKQMHLYGWSMSFVGNTNV